MKLKRKHRPWLLFIAIFAFLMSFGLVVGGKGSYDSVAAVCFFLSVISFFAWIVVLVMSFVQNKRYRYKTDVGTRNALAAKKHATIPTEEVKPTPSAVYDAPCIVEYMRVEDIVNKQYAQPGKLNTLHETPCMDALNEKALTSEWNTPDGLTVHADLAGLLWFLNGPMKNYSGNESSASGYYSDEPSAIDTELAITLPNEFEAVEALDYFPSYQRLSDKQRGKFIQFLAEPYQPIDIGYVFILYYGLERHLTEGDFERAFNVILKLRDAHRNSSFQRYSATALICSAIMRNRKDLLGAFIESCEKSFEKELSVDMLILSRLAMRRDISTREMMRYASNFAFANKRYIQSDYTLFEEQLYNVLRERYGQGSFPIKLLNVNELPVKEQAIFANISLPKRIVMIPDTSKDYSFIETGASALQEAHDRVKAIKHHKHV